jgi:hypothetical protein
MFASKDLFFTNKSGGYQISRSVRLRSSASAYFNRPAPSTNTYQTWTFSTWVKRGVVSGGVNSAIFSAASAANSYFEFFFNNDVLYLTEVTAGGNVWQLVTTQVFRDPSAWYHVVVAYDTTQATSSNRVKLYVNGVQITAFSSASYPALNYNGYVGWTGATSTIGRFAGSSSEFFDGYLTEINFVTGQQLTPSSFGQTNPVTGVWQPIKYTGTYGTNGFYLNFSDNSAATATTIGKDYSGNGNNWTPNNISVTAGATYDSMLDVPTPYADGGNGRGNYAVVNPLSTIAFPLTNGNLSIGASTTSNRCSKSSIAVSSGKWYWEFKASSMSASGQIAGICSVDALFSGGVVSSGYEVGYYSNNGNKYVNGTASAYGASWTTANTIGVALDVDGGTVTFYKDNLSQGSISITAGQTWVASWTGQNTTDAVDYTFGQRPFSYTPPTGFVALNTQNLPTPTISNGANYMAASTYSGTSASQSIVNSGNNAGAISFKPDLVWIKSRSAATDHKLTDSVRGVTKAIISDTTGAETTDANGLTAFNTNGFTIGSDSVYNNGTGPATYVAWQWQAGGTAVSNTAGSITSSVSANPTAGFSVVTYTGTGAARTVGHGLGVAPSFIIFKNRSAVSTWIVYSTAWSNPGTNYLQLNSTLALQNDGTGQFFNSTAATSSVFSIGTSNDVGGNGSNYVAYCFAQVAGYSKFGSYTGNGSADGPFVYLGFRPRWVMYKRTDTSGSSWVVIDTSRDTYNYSDKELYPNLSNSENTGSARIDILSNGYKIRSDSTYGYINASGGTYIFAAFAENPFRNSLAR